MKLEINISKDEELLKFIKNLLKEQIVSITREEVKMIVSNTLKEEFKKKVNFVANAEINKLVEDVKI